MSARFFEGLEGRKLFSGTPVGGGAGPVGPGPNGTGDGTHDRIRMRLQDGSCQATVPSTAVAADAAKDQIRQRLHDGSCQA